MKWVWVKHKTRTWHAWDRTKRLTHCRLLNEDSLRRRPPLDIKQNLPPEYWASVCKRCQQGEAFTALQLQHGERDDRVVEEWSGFVRLRLLYIRVRAKQDDVRALAERLASVGPPSDPRAQAAWTHLQKLLLTPITTKNKSGKRQRVLRGLRSALDQLPPNSSTLEQVTATMHIWHRVAGHSSLGHIDSGKVVANMLAVPDPEAYIRHLQEQGFTTLSSMFSDGVLARAKNAPELRGMWEGAGEYWTQTLSRLNVID